MGIKTTNKHTTDMNTTITITQTTVAVYSIIASLSMIAAHIWGYSRANRKHIDTIVAANENIDKAIKDSEYWRTQYQKALSERVIWYSKYNALQQEIECHQHEVHEEAERPHVVTAEGYWDKESEFLNDVYKKPTDNTDQRIPGTGC